MSVYTHVISEVLNVCKPTYPLSARELPLQLDFFIFVKVPSARVYRKFQSRRSGEWLQYVHKGPLAANTAKNAFQDPVL